MSEEPTTSKEIPIVDGWYFRHPETGEWVRCNSCYECLQYLNPEDDPPRIVENGQMLDEMTSLHRGRAELNRMFRDMDWIIFMMRLLGPALYVATAIVLKTLIGWRGVLEWLGCVALIHAFFSFLPKKEKS